MKQPMINYIQKEKYDELYTPKYAIEPLLKYLPQNITIWECTDFGSSNISKVLEENGHKVIKTNKESFDFLKDTADFEFDIIITNPPYSLKDKFLKKCYDYGKPFALLLPLTALEGTNRGGYYQEFGIQLLVLDKRIDFTGNKSCWFNTSWFCWKLLQKDLIFENLKKGETI
jgi:hypothetical protein